MLEVAGLVCAVLGVLVLFGAGWALLAVSASLLWVARAQAGAR